MLAARFWTCSCVLALVLGVSSGARKYKFFRKSVKGTLHELEETCSQPCQNGGRCFRDRCACPPEYQGEFCEYPVSVCDAQKIGFNGVTRCNQTRLGATCLLECAEGWRYEVLPPTNVYKCSASGEWTPSETPKCVEEEQYRLNSSVTRSRPASGTCAVWGRGHYRTFDGSLFSFRSRCRHLLAHECRGDTFSVHVSDRECPVSTNASNCRRSVEVYVEGEKYSFEVKPEPRVWLGNVSALLPATLGGLRVDYVSGRTIISSQLGFTVVWDGRDLVEVSVDDALKGSMCGLCGQYDDDPSNDFVNSHGNQVSSRSAFLDSWKKDDIGEDCEDIFFDPAQQHHSEELVLEGRQLCSKVTDESFAECHKLVDPKPYSDMCLEDYVSCLDDEEGGCRCSALAEYFRECQRLGGNLEAPWRRDDFCPSSCPAGQVYSQCGASCARTCRDPNVSCQTRPRCIDGCHCPEGTLLHNGQCIRQNQCPCQLHGKEYRAGSLVNQECNSCECLAGEWKCTTEQCPSRCVANGDPFYTTFDGKAFEFSGRCPYYLVRSQNFSVIQQLGKCTDAPAYVKDARGDTEGCHKAVTVITDTDVVSLELGKVTVNTNLVSLPYSGPGVIIYEASSEITKAKFSNGIVMLWDRKSRLHIDTPANLTSQFRGLCGTNNLNQKDDFLTPDGDVEVDVRSFADKWKVDASCVEVEAIEQHPCERSPQKAAGAKQLCKALYENAFKGCHQLVDPEPFHKMCLHRTCACDGALKECLCPALAEYATECSRKGLVVNWREHSPYCAVSCPSHMKWSECIRQKSCFEVAAGELGGPACLEGCSCLSGFAMDGECVAADECPCRLEHRDFPPGSLQTVNGRLCECDNAEWDCGEASADSAVTDLPAENVEDATPNLCPHDDNTEYTACLDDPPRTCDNINLVATTDVEKCLPGCRCKPGFVLDLATNSCISETQCGCKHGGKTHPPGSEIRRDCNKCTCNGGRWDCEKEECPGVCTVWGESHFNTFDGRIFDFRGDCEFMLAKGRLSRDTHFEVTFQSVPCAAGDAVCKRTSRIVLRGKQVITLGVSKKLPVVRLGPGYVIRETTLQVTIFTDMGVVVQWDKGTRISVEVQSSWKGRVKGLCGNFNGNQMDDFQSPSGGMVEGEARVFGDSWTVQESCPPSKVLEDFCEQNPNRKPWAVQKCEVLKSKLFEPCHTEVDLEPYYERCVQDVCHCNFGGDCECLCTNIAAYAHECSAQGIPIRWRSQSLCPVQCDGECSDYDVCISGCPPKTCETLSATGTLEEMCGNGTTCLEGCKPKPCPSGHVLDNERDMKCVLESHCKVPCKEIHGSVYYEGDRVLDERVAEPCESCFCQRGQIVCTGHPCPNTESPPAVECSLDGWTPWLNLPMRASGDFALLGDSQFTSLHGGYCGPLHVADIQCRVAETGKDFMDAGQHVACSLPRGLACYHRDQSNGECLDYEVRLLCSCKSHKTTPLPGAAWTGTKPPPDNNEVLPTTVPDRSRMGRTFPDTETTPYNYVDDGTLPTTTTDGTFIRTDGTATTTDGTFTTTDETSFRTDGTATTTDGTFIRTDGSFTTTDGTFFRTDGTATTTDETFIRTDGTATTTDATFTGTGGTVPNTGGIITTNDGSAMTTDETFTGTDETVFTTVGATTRIDGTVSTTDGDQLRSPTDKPPTLCVSHWTDFFDTDNPDTGDGDVEALKDIRESNTVCGDLVIGDVECRASVNGTLVDYREAGDVGVKCSKFTGLVCLNWLQNRGKTCHDYSVRFFCECGPTPPGPPTEPAGPREHTTTPQRPDVTTTPAYPTGPETSTPFSTTPEVPDVYVTTVEPPQKDQGTPVVCGWTEWMDVDDPKADVQDMGDFETLDVLRARHPVCGPPDIKAIECRVTHTHTDWTKSGESQLSCDVQRGFRCYNKFQISRCQDYEVRLFCACPNGETTPSGLPESTPYAGTTGIGEFSTAATPQENGTAYTEPESTTASTPVTEPETTTSGSWWTWPFGEKTTATPEPETTTSTFSTPAPDVETGEPLTTPVPDVDTEFGQTDWTVPTTASPPETTPTSPYNRYTGFEVSTTPGFIRTTGTPSVFSAECPPGQVFYDCAYQCDQTCHTFKRKLLEEGKCRGDDGCLPGCRAATECSPPFVWHDYTTCIDAEECSCFFEGQILGANQVVDHGCQRCICQDNIVICADVPGCIAPPTSVPQVRGTDIPTTTAAENVTLPASCVPGWTMWFNTRQPDESGDVESVDAIRSQGHLVCDVQYRSEVQCRPATGKVDAITAVASEEIVCDIQTGLVCKNAVGHEGPQCSDYMVRFFCDCQSGTTPPTKVWTPTTPWTSTPVTTPSSTDITTQTEMVYNHTAVETTQDKCTKFIYLVNGPMPLPASSYKVSSSASPASGPDHSRLGSTTTRTSLGAWIPHRQGPGEFIEVDLGQLRTVFGVTTQGRERTHEWVTWYRVLVSADGTQYSFVLGASGEIKEFLGNHDSNGVMRQLFDRPVRARFVRIEPTSWNEVIALRFDVLGCADVTHFDSTDGTTMPTVFTKPTEGGEPIIATMCPELPDTLRHFCPACPDGTFCDGANCVALSRCPCFKEGQLFDVNQLIRTSSCEHCQCTINGHSQCKKLPCRCAEGQRSSFDRNCNCKCAYCPFGQRLCPTTNECIDEFKWCNGVKDCPDDEQDCEATRPPPAISPCPAAKKPNCPSGQYPKLDHAARCPDYVCVPGGDEDECRLLSNAGTCTVSGNIVKTFDGQEFRYEICDHILLQDKKSKQFSVTAHKRCSNRGDIGVCERSVSIMSNDVFVKLGPSLKEVKVNGVEVPTGSLQTISRRLGNVHLALSGQRLVFVSLKHNFQVVFDERQNIKIGVSECLTETTSGLCGPFNFNPSDDFRNPEGRLENTGKAFGDSWATTSASSCPSSRCTSAAREKSRQWCRKLKEAPLSQCLEASSSSMSISICEDFMCDCMSASAGNAKKCMCQAVEGFVATCNTAVRQKISSDWRLSLGCAAECPAGMEWNDCGPANEKTCENMHDKTNDYQEDCVPGCFCPLGQVRRGDTCVPPEFCHDCVCRGHGDPNYITFDGHYYDFQGNCSYVLAQHVSGDPQLDFQVLGTNVECPEEPRTTCTQGVTVSYLDHHVRIVRGQRITFDGYELRDSDYPWNNKGFNISWVPGRSSVVFVPEINLVVRYFELNYGFSIEVPSFTFFNKTEGLCGVCNFDESDDLFHRSGHVTSDVRSFAYSWLVEGTPEICSVQAPPQKRDVPPIICRFDANACDLYVNPELYQKSCQNDAGYSRNLSASVCRSKLQYAEHCCSQGGVSIHRWLQDSGCDSGCPKNMELRCDSGCPKTCDNYKKNEVCPLMATYSCFCKEGFVLKNGECVDVKRCESCDDKGHMVGDTWQTGPCESCDCTENMKVRCTRILCPAPPTCRNDERLLHVPARNGTCCDAYLCDANQLSNCAKPEPIACQPGAVSKLKTDNEGCPSYTCECDLRQCPPLKWPTSLESGLEAFVEAQGCCNIVSVRCNYKLCPGIPKCPPETELKNEPGECCTTYKCVPKNKCAYIHKYQVVNGMELKLPHDRRYQKMYPPESSWTDGLCTNCTCTQHFNQYQYSCRVEVCPGKQEDTEDYEYTVDRHTSGLCCPKQRRTACRSGAQIYQIGAQWGLPGEEKCRRYRCEASPSTGEALKVVLTQICNETCGPSEKYVKPEPGSNDCCGQCVREYCDENGSRYRVGETWTSTLRPCFNVRCVMDENGSVGARYSVKECPKLPANCPRNNIVRDETGCCQKCQVTPGSCATHKLDATKSIEYFSLYDPARGFCSNPEPIHDLAECRGQCYSKAAFSPETNDFSSDCQCCTIKTSISSKVTLNCADGTKIQKQYKNPTECSCTRCGKQSTPSTGILEPIPL